MNAQELPAMFRLKIQEKAKVLGISQRQLMRRSGLDIKVVQRVFRDEQANITMITLDRIAQALKVDVSELIESVPDE